MTRPERAAAAGRCRLANAEGKEPLPLHSSPLLYQLEKFTSSPSLGGVGERGRGNREREKEGN